MEKAKTKLPYVLFNLEKTIYGLSCEHVLSMVILDDVTSIPRAPEYVRGVTNLRGKIISLIDMRQMLGMKSIQKEVTEFEEMMDSRKHEHINWLSALEYSVKERQEFKLTTDPHACAFGKWYDTFKTDDFDMLKLLNKFDKPHKKIHAIAISVKQLQEQKEYAKIEKLIDSVRDEELADMIRLFDSIVKAFKESKRDIVIVLENAKNPTGIIVDKVISIEHLKEEDQESFDVGKTEYFKGIGKRKNDSPVILLDDFYILNTASDINVNSLQCV